MRVLIVTNDYPPQPGGIQQYLANIVDHHRGDIRVLAPARPDDTGPETDPRVRRHRSGFMLPLPGVRRWVEHHVEAFQADVVVFGAPHPLALLGPRIRSETRVPYAVMTHGAELLIPTRVAGLRETIVRPLRQADTVFSVSEFTGRHVERLAGRSAVVLGAGVDLEVFHPADHPPSRLVLGCVSRFVPRKGHDRVIEAAELLQSRGHDVAVLLAGRGRLEGRLREMAAQSPVDVELHVDVPWGRLPELYRMMSVFVMPASSRWFGLEAEGLGIVYLEAAATGIPVVAGRSGGAPETVVEGITGWLAESSQEIASVVEHMISTRTIRQAGAAARVLAEREFGWSAVVDRWDDELGRAVAEPR